MKPENDWNEAEKALFEMYNENHGCCFGLGIKDEVEIPVQISDTVSQHEIH